MHALESHDRVGLVAGQVDEDERDLVAQVAGGLVATDVDGHHRLERDRRLSARPEQVAHAAGAHRQEHVVEGGPEATLHALQVLQRALEQRQPAQRGDRLVEDRHRRPRLDGVDQDRRRPARLVGEV